MNRLDDKQSGLSRTMPELSDRVLQETLAAVRERRRRRQTRRWGTVGGAALAIAVGGILLTQEAIRPEDPSTAGSTPNASSKPAELRITRFSTSEAGAPATRIVQTSECSPGVVLIDDERFLELCGSIGGGLVTLADDRRIAVLASPNPGMMNRRRPEL